jgi:DNA-directed RNA polymerase subunit RPC12/RpoP
VTCVRACACRAAKASVACPDLVVTTCHNYEIAYKFTYLCTVCGRKHGRHSKSVDLERHRCGGCGGRLRLEARGRAAAAAAADSADAGAAAPATPTNGFAAFVKTHFAAAKSEMPGAPHGEVMKALAARFRAQRAGGE